MARGPRKSTKKVTTGKMTKKQKEMVFGDEPIVTAEIDSPEYYSQIRGYQNWANEVLEAEQLKENFLEWANNNKVSVSDIKSLPPYRFFSVGKLTRLANKNVPISDTVTNWINKHIDDMRQIYKNEREREALEKARLLEISDAKTVSKAQRDIWILSEEIYKLLDLKNVKTEDVQKICTSLEVTPASAKTVFDDFSVTLTETNETLKSVGKARLGAYKTFLQAFAKDLTTVITVLNSLVTNLDNAKAAVRKPRKPRAKKAKDPAVLVTSLKFKATDKDLSLSSIAPTSIIGAKALMIFNCHTRKFGIFYASTVEGLSVKGTTILNFDEKKSISKTLRKPNEQIVDLTGGTLKQGEIKLRAIKAVDIPLKGRINEDVLLLKVYK